MENMVHCWRCLEIEVASSNPTIGYRAFICDVSLDWSLICIVISRSTCNLIVSNLKGINDSHPCGTTEITFIPFSILMKYLPY